MRFAVISRDEGEILLTYESNKIEWTTGGYQDKEKYNHLPISRNLDLETIFYDVANKKFSIDQEKYEVKLAQQRENLARDKEYLLSKTDWTQANLRDCVLNEEEIESYAAYRRYVRGFKLLKVVRSLPKLPTYEKWLDLCKELG